VPYVVKCSLNWAIFVKSVSACKNQDIKLKKLANYFSQSKQKGTASSNCQLGTNMLISNKLCACNYVVTSAVPVPSSYSENKMHSSNGASSFRKFR
jgi:hypothetical protein